MKNWFTSLNGAITFSAIALLTEVWRGFLDAMFVFPTDIGEESFMPDLSLQAKLETRTKWGLTTRHRADRM
jgi:hypothetical protein